MSLVHTLLFMFNQAKDMPMAISCLKSLESSSYTTVVICNQGSLSNEQVEKFVSPYHLDCHVIGDGKNVGTAVGRQKCFAYIWENLPNTTYISELHLDMSFTPHWEDPLVQYLEDNDEPLISCGIMDKRGFLPFLDEKITRPQTAMSIIEFLQSLRRDRIVPGFTNPCIHVSEILKVAGGYNADFLKGNSCFEDDSMLLGYYYYYGTKRNWHPKVNYNSVVYHAIAGQRTGVESKMMVNYHGLIKQYGFMGLKALSTLHTSPWHKKFFLKSYEEGMNLTINLTSNKPKEKCDESTDSRA